MALSGDDNISALAFPLRVLCSFQPLSIGIRLPDEELATHSSCCNRQHFWQNSDQFPQPHFVFVRIDQAEQLACLIL